jgi:preprotein translocase subunit SecG
MLRLILTCVQVFSAFAIIGLVLLQRGKGAEAGAGFGAGASGTVFGARGATTALSRATAVFAAIFMVNSLALAYMGTKSTEVQQNTLLEEAAQTHPKQPGAAPGSATPARPAPAPAGQAAGQAPGQPPGQAPASAPASPAPTPPK